MPKASENRDVKLLSYREPDQDRDVKYTARISFAFYPDDLQPLQITRSYDAGDGNWKNVEVAVIHKSEMVEVKEAYIRKSKKGTFYVDVRGLDVPFEVSKRILEMAADRQIEMGKEKKQAGAA